MYEAAKGVYCVDMWKYQEILADLSFKRGGAGIWKGEEQKDDTSTEYNGRKIKIKGNFEDKRVPEMNVKWSKNYLKNG